MRSVPDHSFFDAGEVVDDVRDCDFLKFCFNSQVSDWIAVNRDIG